MVFTGGAATPNAEVFLVEIINNLDKAVGKNQRGGFSLAFGPGRGEPTPPLVAAVEKAPFEKRINAARTRWRAAARTIT